MGCQIEIEAPVVCPGVPTDYVACAEVATKTSLDEHFNVLWAKDERLSVFDHSTQNEEYKIDDADAGKSTAALVKISSGSSGSGTELSANVAYYPYDKNNKVSRREDGYALSVILPASQNYSANSFGAGASPMAAVTEDAADKALSFKNVCGVLKLQLTGNEKIRRITLQGNDGEVLAGAASVIVKSGEIPTIAVNLFQAVLTLDCGEDGVQLSSDSATSFCIVVPPTTFAKGFTATAYDVNGGSMPLCTSKPQSIARSKILKMPSQDYDGGTDPGPEPSLVDLGLSVKWATCNLGASSPEKYGDYYSWGELEPKDNYNWSTYKWCNGSQETLTKYSGQVDNKTVLDSEDDIVYSKFGGGWHMPTREQCAELENTDNCSWEWTRDYNGTGVKGYIIKSKKPGYTDRSIFLPAAGFITETSLYQEGDMGYYWSSSLHEYESYEAKFLYFDSRAMYIYFGYRSYGRTVRPVLE